MKRIIFRLLAAGALALGLAGCSTIPGGEAVATAVAATTDALTGPDTDYTNYLKHCRAEVTAQKDAIVADAEAMKAALTSGNEKTQYGATLIMAFKAGQGGPRISCTASRKKGVAELLLEDNALVELGKDVYFENRAEKRFREQMAFEKERLRLTLDHDRRTQREQNDLIRDIGGTRPDEANRSRAEADRLPYPTAPAN